MIDRVLWFCFAAFVASIMFSIAVTQTLAALLLILWLVKIATTKGYRFKRTVLDVPFLIFLVARIVSVLLSSYREASLPTLYIELPFYIVFFIVTHEFDITNPKRVRLLMKTLFVAASVAACIGMGKYFLGFVHRAESTTSGYYTLGNYLVVVLAMALMLGRNKDFFSERWHWALLVIVLSVGIVFTFNRLHWAAMILLFMLIGAMRERWLLALFIVAMASVIVFVPSVTQRFSDIVNVVSRSSDRDVVWSGALMLADQHPIFGFGPRTFDIIFPLRAQLADKGVASWHNDFVQVYMESGAVGLTSFLFLFGAAFVYGIKTLRNELLPSNLCDLLVASLAALVVLVVVGGILDLLVSLLFRIVLAFVALISTTYAAKMSSSEKLA